MQIGEVVSASEMFDVNLPYLVYLHYTHVTCAGTFADLLVEGIRVSYIWELKKKYTEKLKYRLINDYPLNEPLRGPSTSF